MTHDSGYGATKSLLAEARSNAVFRWGSTVSSAEVFAREIPALPLAATWSDWDRLPWLADPPRARPDALRLELLLWTIAATVLVALTSYSAGLASLQPWTPTDNANFRSPRSVLVSAVTAIPLPGRVAAKELDPVGEGLPPLEAINAQASTDVALELTLVQEITATPYGAAREPEVPY